MADHDATESIETTREKSGLGLADGPGSHLFAKRFELIEEESFWKNHNVQVIIRVRPLNNAEVSLQAGKRCVRQETSESITWIGPPESRFTFDHVADESVTQEKLFKVAGVPMVDNCVSGYNSCMFAYGQTGSGKTHTMLGEIEGGTRRHSANCGMTPRVFEYLFSKIQKEKEIRREEKLQFTCKCSFLEIYNEQILDLLDPSSSNLQIREDLKKGIYVENISEFEVTCARDVIQHLLQGAANRKVASTNMNRASSRSHSVFTCVIESKWESQGITHHRFSRLNLVDLAGSERQKSSGAEGERLKEATNINKSLSTLGLVIMNLVNLSHKKSTHIPYRDSKLTFLLQESLGGNSKTIIIANISPSNCCASETLSTLKFAQRAKFIRNNAIVNEEASGDVLTMRLQIQQLKQEVNRLKSLAGKSEIAENPRDEEGISWGSGSPGSFKWEDLQGVSSPLQSDRKASKRKESEAALVAKIQREKDLELALKARTIEKESAEQLAKQVMDEVKGLKLRLRFREEGIKRLQAVAAGKLSAESHLLQEKEELEKEIELLRVQVDCNPKMTQFAMENLRLKEELRRLQSFVEEGEREMLEEQICDLQEKLLEALDWKLMHEKDSSGFLGLSESGDYSTIKEENEFLRLQAIQNEHQVEALRKNLASCLETKEKLERRVEELEMTVSSGTAAKACEVDAALAKENEDLRAELALLRLEAGVEEKKREEGLRDLHEDKERLMGMYEAAMEEKKQHCRPLELEELEMTARENQGLRAKLALLLLEAAMEEKKREEDKEEELRALQKQNERLVAMYEAAMEDKRHHTHHVQELEMTTGGSAAAEAGKVDAALARENEDLRTKLALLLLEAAMEEKTREEEMEAQSQDLQEENGRLMGIYEAAMEEKMREAEKNKEEELWALREENERLIGMYEAAMAERDDIKRRLLLQLREKEEDAAGRLKAVWEELRVLAEEMAALAAESAAAEEERTTTEERFLLLLQRVGRMEVECGSPGMTALQKRLEQAETERRCHAELAMETKAELRKLLALREEMAAGCRAAAEQEMSLRTEFAALKSTYRRVEAKRNETREVLFAVENRVPEEMAAPPPLKKAMELLSAEEELPRLAGEIKRVREKIVTAQRDSEAARTAADGLDRKVKAAEAAARRAVDGEAAVEAALRAVVMEVEKTEARLHERVGLAEEVWETAVERQESLFRAAAVAEALRLCAEELALGARAGGDSVLGLKAIPRAAE